MELQKIKLALQTHRRLLLVAVVILAMLLLVFLGGHNDIEQLEAKLDQKFDAGQQIVKSAESAISSDTKHTLADLFEAEKHFLTHRGIDISHYQGHFLKEAGKLKGITFIIAKATQGITYVDPDFHNNYAAIRDRGLIRGAYHFYVTSDNPAEQAQHFIKVVKDYWDDKDMAPIVDVEPAGFVAGTTTEQFQQDLMEFLQALEQAFGKKPIIYVDFAFANQYLNKQDFAQYPLWLASYTSCS